MNVRLNELWTGFFGSAWDAVTSCGDDIGAFLALKDTGEVKLDRNSASLLGLSETPGYAQLCDAVRRVDKDGSPICLRIVKQGDGVFAGIVRIADGAESGTKALSLLSQAQLLRQMSDDEKSSLLALIRIDELGNLPLTGSHISCALEAVRKSLPETAVIARQSREQFWIYVPDFSNDCAQLLHVVQRAVEECRVTDEYGLDISGERKMTVSAGCSADSLVPAQRLHTASYALFEALANGKGSVRVVSTEQYELQKSEYRKMMAFTQLIDNNLFRYHFQPIVNAHTGDIVAYEALMRTDEEIGLNPAQILDLASHFGRLYDIEKATFNNTLAVLSENQEVFENRKMFINSISAYMMSEEDYMKFRENYGELLEKVVIELTEQTEISNEALSTVHNRMKRDRIQLAIDDYGTGYSNTSNLLRYNPDFVKIDRSLIANIDINHKTQKIVAGIIDFLHASGYLALAEGVETSAELETMINLSADLIQGYYVSRPKPVLLHEISKNIRDEIVQINIKAKDNVQRIYQPTEGEEIDICMLAVEKYTDIFVDVENIKLIGSADRQVPLGITVKDNAHCEIVMKNVNITSHADTPTVTLGTNSSAVIICDGDNKLCQRGIFVPRSSELTLLGAGSLSIEAESYNCYAIGNDCDHSYGNITVGMTGKLLISANGENSVGIGGGKNVDGSMIRIISGDISLRCTGGTSVGIGSHSDNALIEISDCRCSIKLASTSAVAIGAVTGKADIKLRNFKIKCESAGICNTAVGVIKEGTGNVDISEGRLSVNMRGKRLYCVGTNGGSVNCTLENVKTDFYCEGSVVSGIGDMSGSGDVRIKDSGISMTFLTGEGMALGSPGGKLETVGGVRDIKINE